MAHILVIEDDRVTRRGLTETLRIAGGFEVSEAGDGYEGLEMARANPPDLIICDVEMPRLDGYGVIEALQHDKHTANIPFIFLTGLSDRGSMRQGMVLGADDYISKPFKANELLEAVGTRLAKRDFIEGHYEQKLETLRDNILLAIPHELRTPLAMIIGYGDILADQVDTLPREKIRFLSETIMNAGLRLHRQIANYIIYAQIELLMTEPQRIEKMRLIREAEPDGILRGVVKEKMEQHGRSANLNLHTADSILPISTNNFKKIMEELVDNAFKFSPEETAVTISTTVNEAAFTVAICNQGRGMTQEQIANIGVYMQFERKIHEQQGSGMGLIIAKRLTELYGGQLVIDSTPGGTTCVTVSLPV